MAQRSSSRLGDGVVARCVEQLAERREAGRFRAVEAREAESSVCNLADNDYLRLSQHPEVIAAAKAATERWGASSSASPLISGYTTEHAALEAELAVWAGFSAGLAWNSGYAANQALLSLLPQKGDLVHADRLIHHSMINGLLRSGARIRRYPHLDLDELEQRLQREQPEGNVFVVTESVFSMDGDYPDMARLARLKEHFGFFLIVDEAHALGWYGAKGSGLIEETGIAAVVDVYVGTLGKGLGSAGAFTLFHESALRDFFINFAGEFIYSTYLPPSSAAAARAARRLAEASGAARLKAREHSRSLRPRIGAPEGDSPIVPVVLGSEEAVLQASRQLRENGYRVGAIRPPTVPEGACRLRISLNTALTNTDYQRLQTVWEGLCTASIG